MCGYPVASGYKGLVNSKWILFSTEAEYYEYMREIEQSMVEVWRQSTAALGEGL